MSDDADAEYHSYFSVAQKDSLASAIRDPIHTAKAVGHYHK
jgi:hypothetical protein